MEAAPDPRPTPKYDSKQPKEEPDTFNARACYTCAAPFTQQTGAQMRSGSYVGEGDIIRSYGIVLCGQCASLWYR